ncbi:MAG: sulfur carrier protein [Crocinitomicaceae bacterium]|jgi:sulfur carrier protein
MITVMVNDSQMEVDEKTTIQLLLEEVNTSVNGIAIAINDSIVPINKWESQCLNQNDNILIIKATQGG